MTQTEVASAGHPPDTTSRFLSQCTSSQHRRGLRALSSLGNSPTRSWPGSKTPVSEFMMFEFTQAVLLCSTRRHACTTSRSTPRMRTTSTPPALPKTGQSLFGTDVQPSGQCRQEPLRPRYTKDPYLSSRTPLMANAVKSASGG